MRTIATEPSDGNDKRGDEIFLYRPALSELVQ